MTIGDSTSLAKCRIGVENFIATAPKNEGEKGPETHINFISSVSVPPKRVPEEATEANENPCATSRLHSYHTKWIWNWASPEGVGRVLKCHALLKFGSNVSSACRQQGREESQAFWKDPRRLSVEIKELVAFSRVHSIRYHFSEFDPKSLKAHVFKTSNSPWQNEYKNRWKKTFEGKANGGGTIGIFKLRYPSRFNLRSFGFFVSSRLRLILRREGQNEGSRKLTIWTPIDCSGGVDMNMSRFSWSNSSVRTSESPAWKVNLLWSETTQQLKHSNDAQRGIQADNTPGNGWIGPQDEQRKSDVTKSSR